MIQQSKSRLSDLSNPIREDSDLGSKHNLMGPYLQHKIACCDSKVQDQGPLTAQTE